jgi:rare lipoprotein A (peptidoglycan hydrolase)
MKTVEFLKDRAPFKKGEIIEVSASQARNLQATGADSVKIHDPEEKPANFDADKLNKRQAKEREALIAKLKAKAERLEKERG